MPYSSADTNAFVAFGMQSALGTPQTAAAKLRYMKYLSGTDVQGTIEAVDLREGGDGLDYGYTYKKMQKVTGQIVINARPEVLGNLLALLPGAATWNGASAPAIHTFHTGHASHPWTTLFLQHPGSALPQIVADARFTGLTIEGQSGEPLKLTMPFIGIQHGASYAALTPTYYSEEPFVFHYAPTYVLDGAAATGITGFRIDMQLGVEELQSQAVLLDEIVVQNRDTNFELTRRFEDPALWKKVYMAGGVTPSQSIATTAFRGDMLYGAAAALRQVRLELPLLSLRANALTELDPDGKTVMETVSAKALKGATHAFWAQVTNAHASAIAP